MFLGYIISSDGIKADPGKVASIVNWLTITNIQEVRSFHGLASFYRRFIKNFSSFIAPIIDCLKKNACFEWTKEAVASFELIKEKNDNSPCISSSRF